MKRSEWLDEQYRIAKIKQRLIQARENAGLTQHQAAVLLGLSGASSVAQYEGSRSTPNLLMFLKMCKVYKVSPCWALTGYNPDFDPQPIIEAAGDITGDLENIIYLLQSLDSIPEKDGECPQS